MSTDKTLLVIGGKGSNHLLLGAGIISERELIH